MVSKVKLLKALKDFVDRHGLGGAIKDLLRQTPIPDIVNYWIAIGVDEYFEKIHTSTRSEAALLSSLSSAANSLLPSFAFSLSSPGKQEELEDQSGFSA